MFSSQRALLHYENCFSFHISFFPPNLVLYHAWACSIQGLEASFLKPSLALSLGNFRNSTSWVLNLLTCLSHLSLPLLTRILTLWSFWFKLSEKFKQAVMHQSININISTLGFHKVAWNSHLISDLFLRGCVRKSKPFSLRTRKVSASGSLPLCDFLSQHKF